MALDVKVKIDLLKPVGNLGFGYPLILETGAEKAVAYTECSNIDEVVTAGFANTTEVYKAATLMFMQENAPAKIAVCAIAGTADAELPNIVDKEWRQLIVIGEDTGAAISDYIETTSNKMFFDTVATAPTKKAEYNRTVTFVYASMDDYANVAAAALVGATAGYEAGSFTYKNIVLKGLTAQSFTDAEITAMHANGGITVLNKAGDNVTSEGIVNSGEYIDIIDSQDWIVSNIEYKTQKKLNAVKKIPYTNVGIAMLENVAASVLKTAYDNGMIATNDDGTSAYTVSYALRSESDPADIAVRKYIGGKFAFTLAGAIHNVEVNGEISVA